MSAEEMAPRGDQRKAPALPAVPDRATEPAAPGRPGGLRGRGRGPGGPHGPGFGPPGLVGSGEKAKDFRSSFKRLVGRLRPEYRKIGVVLSLAVASVTVSVAAPLWHLTVEATGNFSFHVAALRAVRMSVPSSVRAIS